MQSFCILFIALYIHHSFKLCTPFFSLAIHTHILSLSSKCPYTCYMGMKLLWLMKCDNRTREKKLKLNKKIREKIHRQINFSRLKKKKKYIGIIWKRCSSRHTKHKNIFKVFEVWMLANAYKGLRTYDMTIAVIATTALPVAINNSHTESWADITYNWN